MTSGPTTAIVPAKLQLDLFAKDPTWQRLWLSLESENWRSLAVIPTGGLTSIGLVHGLAAVAWRQRDSPVIVADLRSIGLTELGAMRHELRRRIETGSRVLIAAQSLETSAITEAVAREADKVLLCVSLKHTTRTQVKTALRGIGQKCLGSIVLKNSSNGASIQRA